jgi:hypothetical protein
MPRANARGIFRFCIKIDLAKAHWHRHKRRNQKEIAMKKLALPLVACIALTGCFQPDPAVSIGTSGGKALYSSTCDVDQSTLGSKAVIGPLRGQIITPVNSCSQPRVTCPNGYDVVDLEQGYPERRSSTYSTGYQLVTRTYYVRETTIQYTCKA